MPFADLKFYQISIVLISLVMIYFGIDKFRRHETSQSVLKLLVRLLVWGGMAVVAVFPELSDNLAAAIGIEGNINAVIFTGFLLVFLLIFKILSVVERIEQEISTLTRKETLAQLPSHQTPKPSTAVTSAMAYTTTAKTSTQPDKTPAKQR